MSGIHVYNIKKETHEDSPNNFLICRPYILGNPYTDIKDGHTLASFVVNNRDTAIDLYDNYFDVMYSGNLEFKKTIDEIYNLYKNGEDVYLGCFCKPLRCHGDIIVNKLRKKLILERINENSEAKKILD